MSHALMYRGAEAIRQLSCLFIFSLSLHYKWWHVTLFSNKHTPPSQYSHPGCPRLSPADPCSSWAVCRSVLQEKRENKIENSLLIPLTINPENIWYVSVEKMPCLAFEQMTNGLPQLSILAIDQQYKDMRRVTTATDERND